MVSKRFSLPHCHVHVRLQRVHHYFHLHPLFVVSECAETVLELEDSHGSKEPKTLIVHANHVVTQLSVLFQGFEHVLLRPDSPRFVQGAKLPDGVE